MSDAGHEESEWRLYIRDMIAFGEKALDYAAGLDQAAFVASSITYDATLRNLQLIGEAATRVPEEVREARPEIEWRGIIATRNRLTRACRTISDDILWKIIQRDVPELLPKLRSLLEAEEGGAA